MTIRIIRISTEMRKYVGYIVALTIYDKRVVKKINGLVQKYSLKRTHNLNVSKNRLAINEAAFQERLRN